MPVGMHRMPRKDAWRREDETMPAGKRLVEGVTLVELLVVLAILVVVAGVALPDLGQLVASGRVKTTATRFMSHVNLARTKSIMSGKRVVLCPSADGGTCLPDGFWHLGWLVFVDRDGDREHAADEPLLQVVNASKSVSLVTSRMRRRLVLYPSGLSPASNGTYTVCADDADAAPLAVIVSNTGRARMSRVRPDGSPLTCS
jgi:type IV fimbrial biogenesis protein FimT